VQSRCPRWPVGRFSIHAVTNDQMRIAASTGAPEGRKLWSAVLSSTTCSLDAKWFPDGRQNCILGTSAGHGPRCLRAKCRDRQASPVFTPDGMSFAAFLHREAFLAVTRTLERLLYSAAIERTALQMSSSLSQTTTEKKGRGKKGKKKKKGNRER